MKKSDFFVKCLAQGKIWEFSRGRALSGKELALAAADLARGWNTFKDGDWKWATVQAYYSMFHSARALLYRNNYREKSHACLIEAMRVMYVSEGLLAAPIIESMQEAKRLREDADYYGEFSENIAKELLKKAEEFLNKAKEIMD